MLTTDFSMPENNGVALIEDLQAKKRSLPAILITGCAAQCEIRLDTASFLSFNKLISWSELQEAITHPPPANVQFDLILGRPHVHVLEDQQAVRQKPR